MPDLTDWWCRAGGLYLIVPAVDADAACRVVAAMYAGWGKRDRDRLAAGHEPWRDGALDVDGITAVPATDDHRAALARIAEQEAAFYAGDLECPVTTDADLRAAGMTGMFDTEGEPQ